MKIIQKSIFVALASLALVACAGGGTKKQDITGTSAKVTEVVNGNTIKLSNNLTVKLLGVENNGDTEKFLKTNVLDKKVRLVADSQDPKQSYIVGKKDRVNAYVNVIGDRVLTSVNGRMVRTEVSKFVKKGVNDSVFIAEDGPRTKLTNTELMALLKPRAFLIIDGNSLGTGFYISSNGLALTNNHVLNFNNLDNAIVVPFNEDGSYDKNNYRNIDRILVTGDESYTQTDYTVFQVRLNGDEKVPFLKLAKEHMPDGSLVGKIGCVSGESAVFDMGYLSKTNDGVLTHKVNINQGDSGGPLINEFGEVIGINQSVKINQNTGGTTAGYAVDIQILRDWFENHRDNEGQLRYGR